VEHGFTSQTPKYIQVHLGFDGQTLKNTQVELGVTSQTPRYTQVHLGFDSQTSRNTQVILKWNLVLLVKHKGTLGCNLVLIVRH
jgi:hypothetical protein